MIILMEEIEEYRRKKISNKEKFSCSRRAEWWREGGGGEVEGGRWREVEVEENGGRKVASGEIMWCRRMYKKLK